MVSTTNNIYLFFVLTASDTEQGAVNWLQTPFHDTLFLSPCQLLMVNGFYQIPQNQKLNSIFLLTSIRYSGWVFAPQLSSPAIPIWAFAARITV